jgi:hypothetical protein
LTLSFSSLATVTDPLFLAGVVIVTGFFGARYRVGDWIILDDAVQGKVIETNWRATHILTINQDVAIMHAKVDSRTNQWPEAFELRRIDNFLSHPKAMKLPLFR